MGELESVRTLADALRSHSHEHANVLHTIASLLELNRAGEAKALIAGMSHTSQDLTDSLRNRVGDPVLTALLLGKSATASERGIIFRVDLEDKARLPLSGKELVTVLGNLLDNAFDAVMAKEHPRAVGLTLSRSTGTTLLEITDTGAGVPDQFDVFEMGATTKTDTATAHGIGLALVRQTVEKHGGTIHFRRKPTTVVVTLPAGAS
ncbi:sensor histidine kinase [Leifsonia xyli]|uniref:sensor histidine kinase n=1 Tax=Leifsonia xyli TaxID=1575 RepID=UPI00040EC201|nr:ATP-binding protein [Leifsonia xyli]